MSNISMGRVVDVGGRFQPLWAQEPPKVAEPVVEEIATSVADDAYRKGYEDGQASAEAAFTATMERERRNFEAEMERSQGAELLNAVQSLSQRVADEITTVGERIGGELAQTVGNLVSRRLTEIERDEVMRAISRVVEIKGLVPVNVAGPEVFVQPLADQLEAQGLTVTREVRDHPDLVVSIDEIELRSALPQWIARMEDVLK